MSARNEETGSTDSLDVIRVDTYDGLPAWLSREVFGKIAEELGGIDVLVNNAGITRDTLVMSMKADAWDDVIATNLRSIFLCSKAVLRPMLRQRRGPWDALRRLLGR